MARDPEPEELLPPAAADRSSRVRLKQSQETEVSIINRPDRSTHPDEKSVLRSGATPGVRTGVADFHGRPHYFRCIFSNGDYTEQFELQPLEPALFDATKEQWAIYRDWERRFHSGEAPLDTHPGHGGVVPRYDELELTIRAGLAAINGSPKVAHASFRAVANQPDLPDGCLREMEVQWTPVA